MYLHKNTLFDLCPRNVAQYPLHHTDYAATKFKVDAANGLGGDTLPRNRTNVLARAWTDGRTDPDELMYLFFYKKKRVKMSILRIRLQYFKGHVYFMKRYHHRNNQYMYKHQKHKIIK